MQFYNAKNPGFMQSKLLHLSAVFILVLITLTISAQPVPTGREVKPTPADERLKKIQQRKALEERSMLNAVQFRNIGPAVMSGRVVDIEVNNEDPTEFYVAYATGGLWHTRNNGHSFTPIFD